MMHMKKRAIIAGLNVPCEEERDEKAFLKKGYGVVWK